MNRRWLLFIPPVLLIVFLVIVVLPKRDHPEPVIGVFLIADHPAVEQIYEGFRSAVQERRPAVRFDVRNANGDFSRFPGIATYFSEPRFDMVFVIGTPCVQVMKSRNLSTPVLFAGVPDPIAAGLVSSYERPGANITGAYLFPPIAPLLDRLQSILPAARRLGVIYNSGEPNSEAVVSRFREEAQKRGYTVIDRTVTGTSQVDPAFTSLLGNIDALYVPTDSTVQIALQTIVWRSAEARIPTFASDTDAVRRGCLFGVAGDYRELGRVAAGMAVRLLNREPAATMSLQTIQSPAFTVNRQTAERIGIDIPASILGEASEIFQTWDAGK